MDACHAFQELLSRPFPSDFRWNWDPPDTRLSTRSLVLCKLKTPAFFVRDPSSVHFACDFKLHRRWTSWSGGTRPPFSPLLGYTNYTVPADAESWRYGTASVVFTRAPAAAVRARSVSLRAPSEGLLPSVTPCAWVLINIVYWVWYFHAYNL